MTELGKTGKHLGVEHPRDTRRTYPMPERATPKGPRRKKGPLKFGYSYEVCWPWAKHRRDTYDRWFRTEVSRDQSFDTAMRASAKYDWYRNYQRIER